MAADGSLNYSLELSARGFRNALGGAQDAVGRFGTGMGRIGGQATAAMAGAGAGAVALGNKLKGAALAVSGLGGAFSVVRGLKLAMEMETTAASMEVLTRSAWKTKEIMVDLEKLSSSTPFQFGDFASAARMSLAFGESAETVVDTMRRLGDVAAGSGSRVSELAEIFGKARVSQTLYTEDLNQMLGRGIPVLNEMASILEVSAEQVKKLASEGKLTFPLLEEAMIRMTSKGGLFEGMMQKLAETGAGKFSTLRDVFDGLLRSFGGPLLEAIKPGLDGMIAGVARLGKTVGGVIAVVQELAASGKLGQAMSAAFDGALDSLGAGLMKMARAAGEEFSKALKGGGSFLGDLIFGKAETKKIARSEKGGATEDVWDLVGAVNEANRMNPGRPWMSDKAKATERAMIDSDARESDAVLDKFDQPKGPFSALTEILDSTSAWKNFQREMNGATDAAGNFSKKLTQAPGLQNAVMRATGKGGEVDGRGLFRPEGKDPFFVPEIKPVPEIKDPESPELDKMRREKNRRKSVEELNQAMARTMSRGPFGLVPSAPELFKIVNDRAQQVRNDPPPARDGAANDKQTATLESIDAHLAVIAALQRELDAI